MSYRTRRPHAQEPEQPADQADQAAPPAPVELPPADQGAAAPAAPLLGL